MISSRAISINASFRQSHSRRSSDIQRRPCGVESGGDNNDVYRNDTSVREDYGVLGESFDPASDSLDVWFGESIDEAPEGEGRQEMSAL